MKLLSISKICLKVTSVTFFCFCAFIVEAQQKSIQQKVDSVLKLMTLDEKIGQLNQYSGDWDFTGPITADGDKQQQIMDGLVGSMLNVTGVEHTRMLQSLAMKSRLRIPLLFGQDVIHGFRTTFPIPLAQSASWNPELIEKAERVAGTEASAYGVHWTFSPMVDIARDPRWGRVMEGAGEDTYLGSLIAAARVKGFQGKGYGDTAAVMACVKHFAGYGAAIGGRDYNSVDMSLHNLWEFYLPPFKAAVDAGVGSVMNSFNDLNGIPATGNRYLMREVLKGKWNFKGIVVSDWGSVGEMVNHGYAANQRDAAKIAINAGCDMDMESRCYKNHLKDLLRTGEVKLSTIDAAVKTVLKTKFELGLFDDPFRFCKASRQDNQTHHPENRKVAFEMAEKSIVLLKNENQVLPFNKKMKKIAFIGPFVKSVRDHLGFWSMEWPDDTATIVTLWDGLKNALGKDVELKYAKGCNVNDQDSSGFAEALQIAADADLVLLSMGEARDMSGEAKSRSQLHLPGVQESLIHAMHQLGKPVVLLIHAGRPLIFDQPASQVEAILYAWWLGSEAGNALAAVLTGKYNPSGKLTMSFPRTEGQIPIYYNHLNTGRPASSATDVNYVSAYTDLLNTPRYPFGFGLSYTDFSYGDILLDKTSFHSGETIKASITITNTGDYDGEETVQLYLRDITASLARPVKELKDFKKIFLKKGESRTLVFNLNVEKLKFYNERLEYKAEPGAFELMIGPDSETLKKVNIQYN